MTALTLFFKECKTIAKSIIYLVFICAMILFYVSQIGSYAEGDIKQYHTNEEYYSGSLLQNKFIKPELGAESYGQKYVEIPEQIMTTIISSLLRDYAINNYDIYPFGLIGRQATMRESKQEEVAQIITDITGVSIENFHELLDAVTEKRREFYENNDVYIAGMIDFSDAIPIIITYDEFKVKMKQLDKILGGNYGESSYQSRSYVPLTYEEALAEYNEFMEYDKITGAYARLFCDYMGIVAALFSVFVPVAFLIRDKRAKVNELIFSRRISNVKFILARYFAIVLMMFIPFILLSLFPTLQLTKFAVKNNMPVDIFAFVKYVTAWILPTLMTTTAVAFIITTITDNPLAIAVQFIWSFLSVSVGAFAANAGSTGSLIYYGGMNLLIRHNSLGHLQYYRDNITQIAVNRIFYAVLSLVLVALTIFIYGQKRRGEVDVRGNLRKIFRNRKSTG